MANEAAANIVAVDRALARAYGRKRWSGGGDVLDGLIRTVLSQSTSDTNSHRAFESLKRRFPTWASAARASADRIEDAIRSGGLARQKALVIKGILNQLDRDLGELSLEFLTELPTEEARRYLERFRGVGPKTVACVLLFDLGRPVFPVDTHVLRTAQRLAWVPVGCDAARAHELLGALIPPKLRYQMHLNLIAQGRAICHPRRPACSECPVTALCPRIAVTDAV
jgi:endonuclease III